MNSTNSEASSEYIESGEPLVLNEAVLNLAPGTAHGALRPNIAPQFRDLVKFPGLPRKIDEDEDEDDEDNDEDDDEDNDEDDDEDNDEDDDEDNDEEFEDNEEDESDE
jgi:hypothetical protein